MQKELPGRNIITVPFGQLHPRLGEQANIMLKKYDAMIAKTGPVMKAVLGSRKRQNAFFRFMPLGFYTVMGGSALIDAIAQRNPLPLVITAPIIAGTVAINRKIAKVYKGKKREYFETPQEEELAKSVAIYNEGVRDAHRNATRLLKQGRLFREGLGSTDEKELVRSTFGKSRELLLIAARNSRGEPHLVILNKNMGTDDLIELAQKGFE